MHSVGAFVLATAPLFLVARADVDFDGDDVPNNCRAICRPIAELSRRCDASDLFDDDDAREDEYERNEDRLRAQCVCTNNSFDVGNIAGLCADCIRQNLRTGGDDDDDHDDELRDINEVIATCGFAANASYAASASTAADSITVVATAPTAASQLTTTFTGGSRTSAAPSGTGTGTGSGSDSGSGSGSGSDSGSGSGTDQNDPSATSNNDDPNDTSLAVPGAVPLGGFSGSAVLCSFGAFVAGVAVLLL